MQHRELAAIGLPGKGYDGFCYRKEGETPLGTEGNIPDRLRFPRLLNPSKRPPRGMGTRSAPH